MGQMFMYDLYQSRSNSEDFNLFTLDHVDAAFDLFVKLKYDQSVSLEGSPTNSSSSWHDQRFHSLYSGNGQGLTITPLPAGHMIGGAIWKISKEGEEEIVYAVDYNHKKERWIVLNSKTDVNMSSLSFLFQ